MLVTDHDAFDYDLIERHARYVLDTRNRLAGPTSVERASDSSRGGPMKVVVTGGAGFIGANLCRTLAATPGVDEVVALDDLSTGSQANLDGFDGVELVEGSILDAGLLDGVVHGADASSTWPPGPRSPARWPTPWPPT